MPILLGSSLDITNISVLLDTPQSRLTGLLLAPTAPALASSVLSPNGTNRSELRFTTAPGQVLDSDQMLASLAFKPQLGLLVLPFVAWFLVLLFRGVKAASGLEGGRLWAAFLVGVVAAELASKALLAIG